MIRQAIDMLLKGESLSEDLAYSTMRSIMTGDVNQSQIAAFLTLLKMKGETSEEIYAFAKVIRENAEPIDLHGDNLLDMCGTGGDGSSTFNISTTSAFVAAACGAKIAKHGNRSITSKSGGADVLEILGMNMEQDTKITERSIREVGIGFLFAQKFHKSFKNVMPVRKELGFKTVFNLLGPLSNPANADVQLLGVYDGRILVTIAESLQKLGVKRAMVVHGDDGLDEITLTGTTHISELSDGIITNYVFDPRKIGMDYCSPDDLKGGTPEENADILKRILSGEKGPKRDITVINAAAAVYISGIADTMESAVEMAELAIDSGRAMDKLNEFLLIR